jgi:hypothetical protein
MAVGRVKRVDQGVTFHTLSVSRRTRLYPIWRSTMRRTVILTVGLLVISLGAWQYIANQNETSASAYTVAEVQTGISHHQALWVGRTIRIVGVVSAACGLPGGCVLRPAGIPPFGIADHPSGNLFQALAHNLPLHAKPIDPFAAWLSQVFPPSRLVLPRVQVLEVGRRATYTVTLKRMMPYILKDRSTACVVA